MINRLGFNNDGADVIAARLRRVARSGRWPGIPVGINIGKSKVTPIEEAADDYLYSFRLLHEFADYVVLNVSSPNTPGLRSLQEHDALEELLRVIHKKNQITRKPILLKIAPDLSHPRSRASHRDLRRERHRRNHRDQYHAGSLVDPARARPSRRFERPAVARKIDRVCASDHRPFPVAGHRFRWNHRRGQRQGKTRSRRAASPGLHRLRLSRPGTVRDRGEFVGQAP